MELRREPIEETIMGEDRADPTKVQPPASRRGTLEGISTSPNPHGAMKTTRTREDSRDQDGPTPRRPLSRLHSNTFHNLIHNYGVENTPHMQLPSGWDTAHPSESDAGKEEWGPTNKDIMMEV
jgi:hypothetical protein